MTKTKKKPKLLSKEAKIKEVEKKLQETKEALETKLFEAKLDVADTLVKSAQRTGNQKRKEPKGNKIWRKIANVKENGKCAFMDMLQVLNRFYEATQVTEDDSMRFRKDLVAGSIIEASGRKPKRYNDLFLAATSIYIRKFGAYEYLVYVAVDSEGNHRSDSWIHIDGIAEEREQLTKKGVTDHPVFTITCMSDLYEHAVKAELEDPINTLRSKI